MGARLKGTSQAARVHMNHVIEEGSVVSALPTTGKEKRFPAVSFHEKVSGPMIGLSGYL